jgi:hypothetical protein
MYIIVGEWLHGERQGQFRIDSLGEISFLEGTYVRGQIQESVQYTRQNLCSTLVNSLA